MFHPYELSIGEADGAHVRLSVHGDVDLAVAPLLLDSILCAAISYDQHEIVVDLAEARFFDSTALGALVEAHNRLREGSSRLVVVNPSPVVARMFEITRLDAVLDVRDDRGSTSLAV